MGMVVCGNRFIKLSFITSSLNLLISIVEKVKMELLLNKIDEVLEDLDSVVSKGMDEKLNEAEAAEVLATLLFEITNASPQNKLVEVRDYNQIKDKSTFRYSGQADTLFNEGLMPEDVYEGLKEVMPNGTRHVGPSYLRVKGLLTHQKIRTFFGTQMAFVLRDYLQKNPLAKDDGFVVFIPNMTGGVWIGDESRRQAEVFLKDHKVWPFTPYMRETRKAIEVKTADAKLSDYVEGPMPSIENTSAIMCFEELRTSAETTKNATSTYRTFGYNDKNDVRIVETCVFDYRHPSGVERLRRLGVDGVYSIGGSIFFDVSRDLGYISETQHHTAIEWLNDPWNFTRNVLPHMKRIATAK